MTRDEIIAAIQECARKLGRPPKRAELRKMAGVSFTRVKREFRGMTAALREAGFDPKGPGHLIRNEDLLLDWARLARKLGKLPSLKRYGFEGRYTHVPFLRRYGSWRAVAAAFGKFAREKRLERQWRDVLKMIETAKAEEWKRSAAGVRRRGGPAQMDGEGEPETWNTRANEWARRKLLPDRGLAGPPMGLEAMAHEPATEQGVVFLFGAVAPKLGFRVLTFRQSFPDCEAMREVRKGIWQRVLIEFEYESRNFERHGHRRDGCDVIVCWRHNWKDCPKGIQVVELRRVMGVG